MTSEGKYVRCVFDPFGSAPARYPDMLSVATSVTSSVTRFVITASQCAATQTAAVGLTVFPHVGSTSNVGVAGAKVVAMTAFDASSSGAGTVFYFDPLHGPTANAGAAFTNWSTYRTIAMGLRVRNITRVVDRAGVAAIRTRVAAAHETIESYNVNTAISARQTTVYDAAECPAGGWNAIWQPNNYSDVSFDYHQNGNFSPALQFMWSGAWDPATVDAQTFEVEVRTIYEYRANEAVAYLFDMETAYGSPARVEGLAADVVSTAGDPAIPGFADRAVKAVDDIIGTPVEIVDHLRHVAREKAHDVLAPFLPSVAVVRGQRR